MLWRSFESELVVVAAPCRLLGDSDKEAERPASRNAETMTIRLHVGYIVVQVAAITVKTGASRTFEAANSPQAREDRPATHEWDRLGRDCDHPRDSYTDADLKKYADLAPSAQVVQTLKTCRRLRMYCDVGCDWVAVRDCK